MSLVIFAIIESVYFNHTYCFYWVLAWNNLDTFTITKFILNIFA